MKFLYCLLLLTSVGCMNVQGEITSETQPSKVVHLVPVVPISSTCLIPATVVYSDFIGPMANVFDDSLTSYVESTVSSGDARVIDVDYGCVFTFHNFQMRNETTGLYAFGTVQVYSTDNLSNPWVYQTTFDESTSVRDGNNWKHDFELTSRYVRYVYLNNTTSTLQYFISDIETSATFLY